MGIMLLIMLFITLGLAAFAARQGSGYAAATCAAIAAVDGILICVMIYIAKFSFYNYTTRFDYDIFNMITNIPIGLSGTATVSNTFFSLYMLTSVMNVFMLERKRRYLLLAVPVIIFFVTLFPPLVFDFYIRTYAAGEKGYGIRIFETVKKADTWILVSITLVAAAVTAKNIVRTRVYMKRNFCIVLLAEQLALAAYVLLVIVFGNIGNFTYRGITMIQSIKTYTEVESIYPTVVPTVVTAIFAAAAAVYNEVFNFAWKNRTRIREIASPDLEKNLRMMLHTHKNIYFTIFSLAQQALDNPARTDVNLRMIRDLSHESMESLSKKLEQMKSINPRHGKIDICGCVETAVERSKLRFSGIECEINNRLCRGVSDGDSEFVTEALINIFNNATEAIEEKGADDGKVLVMLENEDDNVVITVRDNGCGIKKRQMRYIFNVMFSTKQSAVNWGIGLSYAKKIILAHSGSIYAKSKFGEYTAVQITLPIEGGRTKWAQKA